MAGAVIGAGVGALGFPQTITKNITSTQTQTETETQTETTTQSASAVLPSNIPTTWNQTADVVVIGYGGAGAVSAITAYDAGASVIILEKTPSLASLGVSNPTISGGGGNTQMDAGNAVFPMVPDEAAQYLYAAALGTTPMDVCQAWAEMGSQNPTWLDTYGIAHSAPSATTAEFPNLPGAGGFGAMSITGGGAGFFQALDGLVQKRKIPVLFNTPATSLIQNQTTGEIYGVNAVQNPAPLVSPTLSSSTTSSSSTTGSSTTSTTTSAGYTALWSPPTSGGTPITVRANKAVILACGGFEYNNKLMANFLKGYPAHFYGWAYNTGDGIPMAQKVGADLWHMNVMSARMVPWFPEYPVAYSTTAPSQHGWIYVDKTGNRYADETELSTYSHNWWLKLSEVDLTVPDYVRIPSFIIFDQTCCNAGAITSTSSAKLPTALGGAPAWSSNNSVEISKGWIIQGSTIAALVAAINNATIVSGYDPTTGAQVTLQMNMSATNLETTLNNYNGYCTAGVDAQFGRPASTLVPIVTPPFYAMPLWPGGPNTLGGPRRSANAEVLDTNGNPIPRLYLNGELGAIDGWTSLGQNNGALVVFGRISGTNAAALTPWIS